MAGAVAGVEAPTAPQGDESAGFHFVDANTIATPDGQRLDGIEGTKVFVEPDELCGDTIVVGSFHVVDGRLILGGFYRQRSANHDNARCEVDSGQAISVMSEGPNS
jgi:hypothetical protein